MGNSNTIGFIFIFTSLISFLFSILMGIVYKIKKENFENDYLKIKWE
jgi:hypothetical protein